MPGIIDNKETKLKDVLKQAIQDADIERIRIGVGYFYVSGLKTLFPELEDFIDNGGEIDILMGNVVNRKTLTTLLSEYKDEGVAKSKQPNHLVGKGEKYELKSRLEDDFKTQIKYTDPEQENQEYLDKISEWIDEGAIELRVYPKEQFHAKAYVIECEREPESYHSPDLSGIVGSSNLTFSGLTSNTELNAPVYSSEAEELQEWFEERWDESEDITPSLLEVIDNSWASFVPSRELPDPFLIYVKTIYELYKESLETVEEFLRSFDVYEELYDFQRWAVMRAINIARKYGGIMVSDVVGMGKTYVGLALLEHFHHRNRFRGTGGKTLVICPKKLQSMWERMINKFTLHADVLSMGMLSKEEYGEELLNKHKNTSVVLIDESHHFRNTGTNRYDNVTQFLPMANEVILLTATPYTKEPSDLKNQVKLFHPENITNIPITPPNIDEYFSDVKKGNSNLSELLSYVMVRRTRYDIVAQYGGKDEDGREYIEIDDEKRYLPERKLETIDYSITDVYGTDFYKRIVDTFEDMHFARYSLGREDYLKKGYRDKQPYQNLSNVGKSLRGLLKSNILKRLESSIYSLKETLRKMIKSYQNFRGLLDEDTVAIGKKVDELLKSEDDIDVILEVIENMEEEELEDYETDAFYIEKLKSDLDEDIEEMEKLDNRIEEIMTDINEDYSKDDKLKSLCEELEKLYDGRHPALGDGGCEKVVLFTQFGDTVNHLKKGLTELQQKGYLNNIDFETVTSDTDNVDKIIERFAPESNEARDRIDQEDEIDLLISTDVMSEGLNLQDSNVIVNYDIHWNPLKLIQRIGRVDRLGSKHDKVYAFNFLPETELDKHLNIVDKVEKRVNEINSVLGMDGKILTEEDQLNRTFMKRIYDEDIESIEEKEKEILIEDDEITGSVNQLRQIHEGRPELLEKIKKQDGIRSAKRWTEWKRWSEQPFDAVYILCKAGDYTTPYIIGFQEEGPELLTKSQEEALEIISCEEEEDRAEIDEDTFTKRYEKASALASEKFKEDLSKREKLTQIKQNKNREYVESALRYYMTEIEEEEQKKTLQRYIEIVHSVTAKHILKEFEYFRKDDTTGKKLFKGVRELISKYNLEDRFERKKELREELDEPTHVLCGAYLKGE